MLASCEAALVTMSSIFWFEACFRRDLSKGDVGRLSTGVEGGVGSDASPH